MVMALNSFTFDNVLAPAAPTWHCQAVWCAEFSQEKSSPTPSIDLSYSGFSNAQGSRSEHDPCDVQWAALCVTDPRIQGAVDCRHPLVLLMSTPGRSPSIC